MLINNSIHDIEDDADFVIVGSGCAGSTVARYLSAAGKSVILIEEGAPSQLGIESSLEAMSKMYRDAGTTVALGSEPLPLLQGKCLGGGSVINAAIQVRFPEWVWQDWVSKDKKWEKLLPWKELMDANDQLDKDLQIAPTPSHLIGGNGGAMLKGFGDKAQAIRRNAPKCKGSGKCIIGCPNDAKESTDKNYIASAIKNGARVYSNCAVKKVVIKNNRAIGVKGKFASGKRFKAYAKQAVIMAASAIHTPWLLLKSGVSLKGNGFMCHPGASVMGLFEERIKVGPEATQSVESLHWCKEDIKFESMIMPYDMKASRVPGIGKVLKNRLDKLDHTAYWQVACKAQARGKVVRGPFGPLVFYSLSDVDRRNILRGVSMMSEAMFKAGAHEVWPSIYGIPEVITSLEQAKSIEHVKPKAGIMPLAATHLFSGVTVREKFQVEGINGLVIADSSLFPSNIGVNPMSSIMSVAQLVANAWM